MYLSSRLKIRIVAWITNFSILVLSACSSSTTEPTNDSTSPTQQQASAESKEQVKDEQAALPVPKPGKIRAFFEQYAAEHPATRVKLITRLGDVIIRLNESTPLHRANFLFNIERGLYERTIFYRVVPDFMIQGGNSDHDATLNSRKGIGAYYIPSEKTKGGIHQRGALAMAMSYENNPEEKSAQYSYYIVIGTRFSDSGLDAVEEEYGFKIPESSRKVYRTTTGTPHLDGKHTVFGMVEDGMDVVEAIANEKRDSGDWPINDVVIDYEILD